MFFVWKLTQGMGEIARQYLWVAVQSDLKKRISERLLGHLHSLSFRFHVSSKSGQVSRRRWHSSSCSCCLAIDATDACHFVAEGLRVLDEFQSLTLSRLCVRVCVCARACISGCFCLHRCVPVCFLVSRLVSVRQTLQIMDKGTSALESLMEILPFRLFPGQRGNKDWRRRRGKGEKLMYVETRFKG